MIQLPIFYTVPCYVPSLFRKTSDTAAGPSGPPLNDTPTSEDDTAPWSLSAGRQPRVRGGAEAELTYMAGSIVDMLRDTPAEKRWELYEKIRELAMEFGSVGTV